MPWTRHPNEAEPGSAEPTVDRGAIPPPSGMAGPGLVSEILDPILVPLGFAPGQVGGDGTRAGVTFCRGEIGSRDGGCVDLVVDLEATPDWRIVGVRYWGFPSDRWHLAFDQGARLADQLTALARTLPSELG
jgi:hypothetical protein